MVGNLGVTKRLLLDLVIGDLGNQELSTFVFYSATVKLDDPGQVLGCGNYSVPHVPPHRDTKNVYKSMFTSWEIGTM